MAYRRALLASLGCLLLVGAVPALAETVACPELASVVEVGACPGEEDLQYTFKGYCSDNARLYDKGDQVCTDYALYRQMKNVSLWETRDGRFAGYVPCEAAASRLAKARAVSLTVGKQGSVTRVACGYDSGVTFTHRTKARCTAVVADCAGAPGTCQASCE